MIAEFYENSEIFITGGSGVIGKAAIEKLLRSCNVKKIYILLRCKKGVSPEDRLVDIKNSKIFKVLKERKPNELDKLVAVAGDTALDGLGMSPKDRELIKNVSVVFHSAATTRFDEPLKTAVRLNVKSTLEALKIAETMKNLKIFIHVSTFFSNPYLDTVEDKVYPPLFDWRTTIKLLDCDDNDKEVDIITNKLIEGFPNTYIFTKHLAEQVVNEYRFKLPVGIYKPSIVIPALYEPEPGFTETMTGIMGMMVVWGTGLLQGIYISDLGLSLDLTPLDFGTKALLMFAAMKAQLPREKFLEATPVGKFSSSSFLKGSFADACNALTQACHKYPLEKSFWIPNVKMTSSVFLFWFIFIFQQLLPSILLDVLLRLFGKKPFMVRVQRIILATTQMTQFFMAKGYHSDGVTDYNELLRIGEGTEFSIQPLEDYNICKLNAGHATVSIATGCRKFMLNEPDSSIERCKKIFKAKQIVYNILRGYVAYVVIRAIIRKVMMYMEAST